MFFVISNLSERRKMMQNPFLEKLSAKELSKLALENNTLRSAALKLAERKLRKIMMGEKPEILPERIREDRYLASRNLIRLLDRFMKKEKSSSAFLNRVIEIAVENAAMKDKSKFEIHNEKYGCDPPYFVTLSPGQGCNLSCKGCYAGDIEKPANLDYDVVSRIIRETEELWGSHFTVISGGEPLIYRSNGKSILDLFAEHQNEIFLMYTNGTLITKKVAERMAELGNILPAISVEGFEEETDERRGEGAYERILQAFENLREAGAPFGISVTATRDNAELIVSDEFLDFYFEEQGIIFGWIFQYMPIGRSFTLDEMVTPEQRLSMLKREEEILREKGLFYIDFWNSGCLSRGCISAGRSGGYFYINWNGDVSPCVFFPYSVHNIYDVYEDGGNLNTVWESDLFSEIRNWQQDYGYEQPPISEKGNWITPCPIRDHYDLAYEAIKHSKAHPIDKDAKKALNDPEYRQGMIDYDGRIDELTRDIWKEEYLRTIEE